MRSLALLPLYIAIALALLLLIVMYAPDTVPASPLNPGSLGMSTLVTLLSKHVPTKILLGKSLPRIVEHALVLLLVTNSTVSALQDIVNMCRNCTILVLPCSSIPSLGTVTMRPSRKVMSMLAFVKFPVGRSVQIPSIQDRLPIVNASLVKICNATVYAISNKLTVVKKGRTINVTALNIPVAAYCTRDSTRVIILPTCYMFVNKLMNSKNAPNRRYILSMLNETRPETAYIILAVPTLDKDFLLRTRLVLGNFLNMCREVLILVIIPIIIVYIIILVFSLVKRK